MSPIVERGKTVISNHGFTQDTLRSMRAAHAKLTHDQFEARIGARGPLRLRKINGDVDIVGRVRHDKRPSDSQPIV